jgi:hypothetical protein
LVGAVKITISDGKLKAFAGSGAAGLRTIFGLRAASETRFRCTGCGATIPVYSISVIALLALVDVNITVSTASNTRSRHSG